MVKPYWLCRILKEQVWTFCLKEKIKIRCRGARWQWMKHSLFFSVFICPLEYTGNSVQRFQKCPHWRAFSKTFEDRFQLIRARATPQNNFPFSKDPDTYVWIVNECGECFVCCKVLFQQADKFDPQKTCYCTWKMRFIDWACRSSDFSAEYSTSWSSISVYKLGVYIALAALSPK